MESRFTAHCRRVWKAGLGAAVILVMATASLAGQPSGTAHVDAVDPAARTIVLLGETYRVPPSAHFTDAKGQRADLKMLRARPQGALLVSEDDMDVVRWKAVQTRTGWVIEALQIRERMPE